jgi:DNA-binding winged helix-turn-helix (wHTH) protein
LDRRSLELVRGGRRLRLQDKPTQVLIALLERPGEFITREELFKQLWPGDTFVDFDNSLNNAVSKLRSALGDAAEKPRFVETVGRRGYRFIGSIEDVEPQADQAAALPETVSARESNASALSPAGSDRTLRRGLMLAISAAVVTLAFAMFSGGSDRGWRTRFLSGKAPAASVQAPAAKQPPRERVTSEPLATVKSEVALLEAGALVENGQLEEAYARVLRGRSEMQSNSALSFAAAYVLTYAGYLDDAAWALEEMLAHDAQYLAQSVYSPNALLYQHHVDRFLTLLPSIDTPMVRFYRTLADVERGRRREADPVLGELFERNPHDLFARLGLALNAALSGRQAEVQTLSQALSRERQRISNHDGEITFKQAQILSFAGHATAALAELDRAVAEGFVCVACIEQTSLLEGVRATTTYRTIIDRARLRHEAFGRRFGLGGGSKRTG